MTGAAAPPSWPEPFRHALAAAGIHGEHPTAELIALGAIARYSAAPTAPGSKAIREAAAALPQLARQLANAVRVFQSAARTTPNTQPERQRALSRLAHDLDDEFRLDPAGPAGRLIPVIGMPAPLEQAAQRAEDLIRRAQLDQLPPSPPRAPRPMFDSFIADLAVSYRLATGRPASAAMNGLGFTAPFVRFVAPLWREASDELAPGWGAIGGALRRITAIASAEPAKADGLIARAADAIRGSEETAP